MNNSAAEGVPQNAAMEPMEKRRARFPAVWVASILIVAVLLRILTLAVPVLIDTTEGRFGSVAMRMWQTGNWITPFIHLNSQGWVPYWAKPPFFIWVLSISFGVFGFNEFAARFPSFLALLGSIYSSMVVVSRLRPATAEPSAYRLLTALLFISSIAGFCFFANCNTDATLCLFISWSLASYGISSEAHYAGNLRRSRLFGYLFFAALGLGILTKGPVAAALPGLAIGLHSLLARQCPWKKLPWTGGLLLMLAIGLPWYIVADFETPGFLRYFIVEENLNRYITHDLKIRYGKGHLEPYGMIWLFLVGVFLPWSCLLPSALRGAWRQRRATTPASFQWPIFLICWFLSPLIFFTLARQILPTYCFPSIPAASALCAAYLLQRRNSPQKLGSLTHWVAVLLFSLTMVVAVISLFISFHLWPVALLALALSIFWYLARYQSERIATPAINPIVSIALGSILLMSATLCALEVKLGANRSSGIAAKAIVRDAAGATEKVAVLYGDPGSAHFYIEPHSNLTLMTNLTPHEALAGSFQNVLLEKKRSREVPPQFFTAYHKVAAFDRWIYYRKN